MRIGGFSMEVNEPCPFCRGTGHSGNLHDETCSECDGSRRLVLHVTPEERERFLRDPKFYAMVGILERLRKESGFTHTDMASALDLAGVSLHENNTRRGPDQIQPAPYHEAYEKMRELEAILIAHAAGVYVLPPDAVPGQVWPRTRVVPATEHVDPKLPPRPFVDTDKEWP